MQCIHSRINHMKISTTVWRIMKSKGVKAGSKLYNTMRNRRTMTTLVRLRTSHCGLNHYLYRFNIKNISYCECGQGKETVEHYLLECRKYNEQRKKLRKEVGIGKMKIAILGYPKIIKHMMKFVRATKGSEI